MACARARKAAGAPGRAPARRGCGQWTGCVQGCRAGRVGAAGGRAHAPAPPHSASRAPMAGPLLRRHQRPRFVHTRAPARVRVCALHRCVAGWRTVARCRRSGAPPCPASGDRVCPKGAHAHRLTRPRTYTHMHARHRTHTHTQTSALARTRRTRGHGHAEPPTRHLRALQHTHTPARVHTHAHTYVRTQGTHGTPWRTGWHAFAARGPWSHGCTRALEPHAPRPDLSHQTACGTKRVHESGAPTPSAALRTRRASPSARHRIRSYASSPKSASTQFPTSWIGVCIVAGGLCASAAAPASTHAHLRARPAIAAAAPGPRALRTALVVTHSRLPSRHRQCKPHHSLVHSTCHAYELPTARRPPMAPRRRPVPHLQGCHRAPRGR